MLHLPRILRIFLIGTGLLVLPTLYVLYPKSGTSSDQISHATDAVNVEAGGIDSEHWREAITPDPAYGAKLAIGEPASPGGGWEEEKVREWGDEFVVGGGHGIAAPPAGNPGLGVDAVGGTYRDESGKDLVAGERLGDGVIMPKLGNATAK